MDLQQQFQQAQEKRDNGQLIEARTDYQQRLWKRETIGWLQNVNT